MIGHLTGSNPFQVRIYHDLECAMRRGLGIDHGRNAAALVAIQHSDEFSYEDDAWFFAYGNSADGATILSSIDLLETDPDLTNSWFKHDGRMSMPLKKMPFHTGNFGFRKTKEWYSDASAAEEYFRDMSSAAIMDCWRLVSKILRLIHSDGFRSDGLPQFLAQTGLPNTIFVTQTIYEELDAIRRVLNRRLAQPDCDVMDFVSSMSRFKDSIRVVRNISPDGGWTTADGMDVRIPEFEKDDNPLFVACQAGEWLDDGNDKSIVTRQFFRHAAYVVCRNVRTGEASCVADMCIPNAIAPCAGDAAAIVVPATGMVVAISLNASDAARFHMTRLAMYPATPEEGGRLYRVRNDDGEEICVSESRVAARAFG